MSISKNHKLEPKSFVYDNFLITYDIVLHKGSWAVAILDFNDDRVVQFWWKLFQVIFNTWKPYVRAQNFVSMTIIHWDMAFVLIQGVGPRLFSNSKNAKCQNFTHPLENMSEYIYEPIAIKKNSLYYNFTLKGILSWISDTVLYYSTKNCFWGRGKRGVIIYRKYKLECIFLF